jgi:hypothetical protein
MMKLLRDLFRRTRRRPSHFDLAIASILILDAARQEVDVQTPPSPPAKPIGLRKILTDLPD